MQNSAYTLISKMDVHDTQLCAANTLRMVSRALTRHYEHHLREVDLTIGQFSILSALAQMANGSPPDTSTTALADALALDRTTLTRNLAPLGRRGLVHQMEGDDRRARLVSITGRGRTLLGRALPLWERAQEETLDSFGRQRWRKLQRDLLELAKR